MDCYARPWARVPGKIILLLFSLGWSFPSIGAESAKIPLTPATPESQQLDSTQFAKAIARIADGQYGEIDSLLILRHGYLVLEHYFSPQYHGQGYRQPLKSVTKSVTSALVGIALEQGYLPALETRLTELFPQYPDIDNLDARKKAVTLEHILAMTAGFEWDEFSIGYNSDDKMLSSPDWIRFVLDLPMSHAPGETWVYNSGCSLLLSQILRDSTGQAVDAFARKHLFGPIGIEKWNWSITKNSVINTAWGLAMSRRDMARFGMLILNEGRWQDRQVVPAEWIRRSTGVKVLGTEDYFPYAYGYHWWRLQDPEPTVAMLEVNDAYFALGFGGQFIFIVPHLDLVVVSTASNFGPDEALFLKLLRDHIFTAVMD